MWPRTKGLLGIMQLLQSSPLQNSSYTYQPSIFQRKTCKRAHAWTHTAGVDQSNASNANGRGLVMHHDVIQALMLSSNKPAKVKHCVWQTLRYMCLVDWANRLLNQSSIIPSPNVLQQRCWNPFRLNVYICQAFLNKGGCLKCTYKTKW